jgi:hypothetical protein
VLEREIEVLFGAASFHGTDLAALAQPLSYLAHTIWRRPTCGCAPFRRMPADDP